MWLYGSLIPMFDVSFQSKPLARLNHFWPLISQSQNFVFDHSQLLELLQIAWAILNFSIIIFWTTLNHPLGCNDSLLTIFGPIPNLIFDCSKLLSLTTCGGNTWRSRTFHIFHPYVGGSADTCVQYIRTWNDCDYNIHVQGFIQKKFGGSIWKLCSIKRLVTFWRVWLTALC